MRETLDRLTLRLEGQRITADRFLRAAESFFGLLGEVSEALTGKSKAFEWLVSVERGSIVLGARAEPSYKTDLPPAAIVEAAYSGFKKLQERKSVRPEFFNDDALQSARDLAKLVDGKAVRVLQIRRSRNSFTLKDDKVVRNVDLILGGTATELGTIEGKLEMISARGCLHVGVWDALTDRQVRCFVRPGLLEEAKAAFGRRVAVTGTIRYRPNGEPVSIEVDSLEVFPGREDLPSAEDVYGILATLG